MLAACSCFDIACDSKVQRLREQEIRRSLLLVFVGVCVFKEKDKETTQNLLFTCVVLCGFKTKGTRDQAKLAVLFMRRYACSSERLPPFTDVTLSEAFGPKRLAVDWSTFGSIGRLSYFTEEVALARCVQNQVERNA